MSRYNNDPVNFGSVENQLAGGGNASGSKKKSVFKTSEQRGCTDILFLVAFLVFWVAMFAVGIYAFVNADLDSLVNKRDFEGNYCAGKNIGGKPNYEGKKLFILQGELANAGAAAAGGVSPKSLPGICVKECPKAFTIIKDPYEKFGIAKTTPLFDTFDLYGTCLPSKKAMANAPGMQGYANKANGYTATIKRIFQDIYEGSIAIFGIGGFFCLVLCLIWLALMAKFSYYIVWVTILLFFVVFATAAGVSGCQGYNWNGCASLPAVVANATSGLTDNSNMTTASKVGFWLCIIPTVGILLATICLRKQIELAAQIMAEVSKALMQMFSLVLFPIVPFLMLLVLFAWWTSVSVALYSLSPSGSRKNITLPETGTTAAVDNAQVAVMDQLDGTSTSHLWWFHFFGLLWSVQVIEGISLMTIAGSFCAWYWRDDKSELGHAPVLAAFFRCMRYHLGTVMFGGLIVAIVQFIRAVLAYVQKKLEKEDNPAIKIALCILQCCFWCMEKILKFINKQAYIQCAMKGTNFCRSAISAVTLIFKNAARVSMLAMAVTFVVAIGKFMIIVLVGLVSYEYLDSMDDVVNPIAPALVAVALAYGVTHNVMGIYDYGTDTIMQCVLEDEDANKGTGQYFAPPNVAKMLARK